MDLLQRINRLPPIARYKSVKQMTKELYQESLFLTARHLLGFRDVNRNTHLEMIQALEAPTKRKLIVMPRGSLKSSLASVAYPIWLLNRDPNLRILIDSELYKNSSRFLREIAMHMETQRLISLFGTYRGSIWNEGEIIIKQRSTVLKEASITASGIGAQKTSQHYDVVIMDDMNSRKNSQTPELRQKVLDHYKMNTSILEPGGILVVVGTRYSADDVIGFCLKNEIGITI